MHHLYDDGDLYYYSACDGNLYRDLDAAKKTGGLEAIARFTMMGCGMNLGDYSCGEEAASLLKFYPMIGAFGEITLQSDDINNVTIKGGNWTYTEPSIKKIIEVAGKQKNKLPFVFLSDARSVTTKPYRKACEQTCCPGPDPPHLRQGDGPHVGPSTLTAPLGTARHCPLSA